MHSTSLDVLETGIRKNQDWFDDNDDQSKALLERKCQLHLAYQMDLDSTSKKVATTTICRDVQFKLESMQDTLL